MASFNINENRRHGNIDLNESFEFPYRPLASDCSSTHQPDLCNSGSSLLTSVRSAPYIQHETNAYDSHRLENNGRAYVLLANTRNAIKPDVNGCDASLGNIANGSNLLPPTRIAPFIKQEANGYDANLGNIANGFNVLPSTRIAPFVKPEANGYDANLGNIANGSNLLPSTRIAPFIKPEGNGFDSNLGNIANGSNHLPPTRIAPFIKPDVNGCDVHIANIANGFNHLPPTRIAPFIKPEVNGNLLENIANGPNVLPSTRIAPFIKPVVNGCDAHHGNIANGSDLLRPTKIEPFIKPEVNGTLLGNIASDVRPEKAAKKPTVSNKLKKAKPSASLARPILGQGFMLQVDPDYKEMDEPLPSAAVEDENLENMILFNSGMSINQIALSLDSRTARIMKVENDPRVVSERRIPGSINGRKVGLPVSVKGGGTKKRDGMNVKKDVKIYSKKVFVGGLPQDVTIAMLQDRFKCYGAVSVSWPHSNESLSDYPPKGFVFLQFQDVASVGLLLDDCTFVADSGYFTVMSTLTVTKAVQVKAWEHLDADLVLNQHKMDPRHTVFIGGVPRPVTAKGLADVMSQFGRVSYAGIDVDVVLGYPKGSGRVVFESINSCVSAISTRFIDMVEEGTRGRLEIKAYVLADMPCDLCKGERCMGNTANFFCSNIVCLKYLCSVCWIEVHSKTDGPNMAFHKPQKTKPSVTKSVLELHKQPSIKHSTFEH